MYSRRLNLTRWRNFACKLFLPLALVMYFFGKVSGQQMNISKLQSQVEAIISKTRTASVFITDFDLKTRMAHGGRFSGVVVNSEGIILTVAHATRPGQNYQVTFPSGKSYMATGLGKVSSIGVAMLKLNDKGSWPTAEMGSSAALKLFEPCISIAYPASFDNKIPVVRFGYVAEVSSKADANRIRTTCLMEPGDSGGPVFDLSGKIIGMNNNIDRNLDANYEVPIDLYKKYWNALLEPEDYLDLPIGETIEADTVSTTTPAYRDIALYGNSMAEVEKRFSNTVIGIESVSTGNKYHILGTLISFDAATYVLSKNSLVGDSAVVRLSKGQSADAATVYRDVKMDLVLLKLKAVTMPGIPYKNMINGESKNLELGRFLYSPLTKGETSWSIIGSDKFNLDAKFSGGYSGTAVSVKGGKLLLEIVQPNTGAGGADLKVGDEILAVDGRNVVDPDGYVAEVRKKSPGESVLLSRSRDGKKEDITVRLGRFPVIPSSHPASFFEGGASGVRDGFSNVYVHDSRLIPTECGGPVFDLNGSFIGINIARYSRTSNILLSAPEVANFLQKCLATESKTH